MKKNVQTIVLVAAAFALAALGCLYLGHYPTEALWGGVRQHLFAKQLLWNALGLALAAAVYAIGWKRALKAAPFVMIAWIALFPTRHSVHAMLPTVLALFVAWLIGNRRLKPWMVYTLIFGIVLFTVFSMVLANPNRLKRLLGVFGMSEAPCCLNFLQVQMHAAIHEAKWLGNAGRSLRFLPCAYGNAALAGLALTLGKGAVVFAIVLMGVIGGCLAALRKRLSDPAMRHYLLVFTATLLGMAAWSVLQHVELLPCLRCTFPLVTYGGMGVLFTWVGIGFALSTMRGDDEGDRDGARPFRDEVPWIAWGGLTAGVLALVLALCCTHVRCDRTYAEPQPEADMFGPYGSTAVRGTILAAGGETLAQSYGDWQARIDPCAVAYAPTHTTNQVVAEVSKRLALTEEAVHAIYTNRTSRYILARRHVEGEMLEWCRRKWTKRIYGVMAECVQRRGYPLGRDAAHVTGCCLAQTMSGDAPKGALGLEFACHDILAGQNGKTTWRKTLAENMRTGFPTNGGTVKTTIRVSAQRAVAAILNEAATAHHAESAWAMAVKVPSGEIVAMASHPTFDPNLEGRAKEHGGSTVNAAVQTIYEPGELMKPIVYALSVQAGCAKPEAISDWYNATFMNLCRTIGTNGMWQGLAKFSFGKKLGEGFLYGEQAGIVRSPEKWTQRTLECLGKGQGIAVTGLQIAQAYATLANGGLRVTPYLVETMTDAKGNAVFSHEAKGGARVVAASAAAATTRRIGKAGFAGMGSTFALVEPHREHEEGRYSVTNVDVLYAGYFPIEKPEYAVVVGFRKPQPRDTADALALPAFKKIIQALEAKK